MELGTKLDYVPVSLFHGRATLDFISGKWKITIIVSIKHGNKITKLKNLGMKQKKISGKYFCKYYTIDLYIAGERNITEFAYQHGLENPPYFSQLFKKEVCMIPKELKNQLLN